MVDVSMMKLGKEVFGSETIDDVDGVLFMKRR